MNKTPEQEFKDLSVAFAKLKEDFKVICAAKPKKTAAPDPDANNEMNELKKMITDMVNNHSDSLHNHMSNLHQNVHGAINNLHERLNRLHDMHFSHASASTHVPPLQPTQMNKLLKMCGADGDVKVLPKQIYSNYIEAAYIKPDKK